MENQVEQKTNAGQGLGIAALILGIISFPVALIPCFGITATLFAVVGVILSAIGLSQATKRNGAKGLNLAGLILSSLALLVIVAWSLVFAKAISDNGDFKHQIRRAIQDEFSKQAEKDAEDASADFGTDLEKQLEELEADTATEKIEMSSEDFQKLLQDYEKLTQDVVRLSEKARNKDLSAVDEYAKVAARAAVVASQIMGKSSTLSKDQLKKFQEIQKKYEEAMKKAAQ